MRLRWFNQHIRIQETNFKRETPNRSVAPERKEKKERGIGPLIAFQSKHIHSLYKFLTLRLLGLKMKIFVSRHWKEDYYERLKLH